MYDPRASHVRNKLVTVPVQSATIHPMSLVLNGHPPFVSSRKYLRFPPTTMKKKKRKKECKSSRYVITRHDSCVLAGTTPTVACMPYLRQFKGMLAEKQ
jgi:hypothetical protein